MATCSMKGRETDDFHLHTFFYSENNFWVKNSSNIGQFGFLSHHERSDLTTITILHVCTRSLHRKCNLFKPITLILYRAFRGFNGENTPKNRLKWGCANTF